MPAQLVGVDSLRRWPVVAAAFALAGCVADGWYVVRGRVAADTDREATPIAGAYVKIGPERRDWADNGVAWTAADGTYETRYWFGGMWPRIEGADPAVLVTAPGHASNSFDLHSTATVPGVTRRPCGTAPDRWCFVLDVVLRPDTRTGLGLLWRHERGLSWAEVGSLFMDVTGDGVPDLITLGTSAEQVAVGVVAGPLSRQSKVWASRFPVAPDLKDGVCGPAAGAKLSSEGLRMPLEESGCGGAAPPGCEALLAVSARLEAASARGVRGIRLDSGDCDALHLYLDEGELRWWRH